MPATIFNGSKVKALKDTLSLNGGAEVISTTSDPSSGGGLAAPIGSIALNTSAGTIYQKTGAADTAWGSVSSAGSLPVTGGTMTGDITLSTGVGLETAAGVPVGGLIGVQIPTTSYTPTTGTRMIVVELVGGGGGGGGANALSVATTSTVGGGGGGGGYVKAFRVLTSGETFTTVTVGTAGSAGSIAGTDGTAGGNTSLVSSVTNGTISANGGQGGSGMATPATTFNSPGGVGGSTSIGAAWTAIASATGQKGQAGAMENDLIYLLGSGGSSQLGLGGQQDSNVASTGETATGYGAGGSGGVNPTSGTGRGGGAGSAGRIIIYEYV